MTSLYVHVPFCIRKCSYCAFYSVPLSDRQNEEGRRKATADKADLVSTYINGVAQEIKMRSKEASEGVSSLFIGGGTPTVLSAGELERLLNNIHNSYTFVTERSEDKQEILQKKNKVIKPSSGIVEKTVEKTVEANPGTLSAEKLEVLSNYGINRISLGVQSFDSQMLKRLGRIHNAGDIRLSVELIRKAGFNNLNLDLIFGLPGQSLADWQDTVLKALELSPEHLSIYALTLEEDTPFGRKYISKERDSYNKTSPDLPDDDLQADMYEWTVDCLLKNGYNRYEISNFARRGKECRHNLGYWQAEDYIGLGPGAVSCLGGVRTKNVQDIKRYTEKISSGMKAYDPMETEILTQEQLIAEYIMLGLRTVRGIDLDLFAQKFKIAVQDIFGHEMAKYIDREILIIDNGKMRLSQDYLFISNSIIQEFIR